MQPCGLPSAASGIAHSSPVETPEPDPAAQPAVTPPRLLTLSEIRIPYGFVPEFSVPGPPGDVLPRNDHVPVPTAGLSKVEIWHGSTGDQEGSALLARKVWSASMPGSS